MTRQAPPHLAVEEKGRDGEGEDVKDRKKREREKKKRKKTERDEKKKRKEMTKRGLFVENKGKKEGKYANLGQLLHFFGY